MGTKFSISISSSKVDSTAFLAAFDEVKRVEEIFSSYMEDSELSQINKTSTWYSMSKEMLEVLSYAEQLRIHSNGAFDVRLGKITKPLKNAIRTGKSKNPSFLDLEHYELYIEISSDSIKTKPTTQLDFGGIAKGYAVDKAFEKLIEMGFDTILVDGGGDMRMGHSPNGRGWKIAQFYEDFKILRLENTALASSGRDYQHIEVDSIIYSHIVDPVTALPVVENRGVAVQAGSCMLADALATAISTNGEFSALKKFYEFRVNIIENGTWTSKQF